MAASFRLSEVLRKEDQHWPTTFQYRLLPPVDTQYLQDNCAFTERTIHHHILPKSRFGKAVTYLKNQWPALQRYLSDPRLPIDSDQAEQTIRPLTVGRRNWLFLAHPRAAPGRLQLLSIVSSAQRHHLILEEYLSDVLRQLAHARQNRPGDLELNSNRLRSLLPDRWAEQHPKSIRQARVEEKTDPAPLNPAQRQRPLVNLWLPCAYTRPTRLSRSIVRFASSLVIARSTPMNNPHSS